MPQSHPTVSGLLVDDYTPTGYVRRGTYMGANLPTTANIFQLGCEIIFNGKTYHNIGTLAAPVWGVVTEGASHKIIFFKLGSSITTTALVGVLPGDLVVSVLANGTATVAPVATADTLPSDPADTTYLFVVRAIS